MSDTIVNLVVLVLLVCISVSSSTPTITFHIAENSPFGANISTINIACKKYILQDLSCCSVDDSGDLSVAADLDRETQDIYEGKLVCTMDQSPYQARYKVLIVIDDVDDNVPVFDKPIQNLNISEQAKLNQHFPLEGARDDDTDVNSVQGYTLDDDTFGVKYGSLTNGVLPLSIYLKHTLDYETGPHYYNITITAYDIDNTLIHLIVIINIIDENDNKPIFDAIQYKGSISESSAPHVSVLNVSASDADSGLNAELKYTIVSDTSYTPFKVSLTGQITVDGPLDRETTSQYIFQIRAEDKGEPPLSSVTGVKITVLDDNDNIPKIVRPTRGEVIRVRENLSPTLITSIKISDLDIGRNAQVDVVVEGVHSDRFQYNYQSTTNYFVYGTLTTTVQLDREDIPQYILVLKVTDKGLSPLSSKVQFIVVVDDDNDNVPVLDCSTTFTTLENYIGPIGALTATDKDEGWNAELLYFVQTPKYPGYIGVKEKTGQLSILIAFDAEEVDNITMYVHVKDNGTIQYTTQCNITLFIVDVNDNKPHFTKDVFTFNVLENVNKYTLVGVVRANDRDRLDQLSYSLEKPSSAFTLVERNGDIRVHDFLDRETTSSYRMRCIVTDSLYNDTSELIINVLDVNDEPPIFQQTPYTASISATASIGKVLFRPVVSDNDDVSILSFSLNNTNLFSVDRLSGAISVLKLLPVPSELKEELTVYLSVTDGVHSVITGVKITVYSNDGTDPVIKVHQGFHIKEDCLLGTIVGKCNGTSLYPTFLSLLTYKDYFIINTNGDIITRKQLDYEQQSHYILQCKLTDLHGNHVQTSIMIDIIGVNEFQPVFEKNFYTFSIVVPDKYPSVIGTVRATDNDSGNDGLLKYYLISNNSDYTINKGSGEILLKYKPQFRARRDIEPGNYHSINLDVGVEDSPLSMFDILKNSVQITVSIYPVEHEATKIVSIVGYSLGGVITILIFCVVICVVIQRRRRSQRGSKDVTYVNPTAMLHSFRHLTPHEGTVDGQIVLGSISKEPYTSEELGGYHDVPLSSICREEKGSVSTILSDYRPQLSRNVPCSIPLKSTSQESVHIFETEGGGEGDAMLDTVSLFNKLADGSVIEDKDKALFLGHDSAFSSLHSSSGDMPYNTEYLHDWRPDFQSVGTVAEGMLQCKEFAYKQSCSPCHTLPSSHDNSSHDNSSRDNNSHDNNDCDSAYGAVS